MEENAFGPASLEYFQKWFIVSQRIVWSKNSWQTVDGRPKPEFWPFSLIFEGPFKKNWHRITLRHSQTMNQCAFVQTKVSWLFFVHFRIDKSLFSAFSKKFEVDKRKSSVELQDPCNISNDMMYYRLFTRISLLKVRHKVSRSPPHLQGHFQSNQLNELNNFPSVKISTPKREIQYTTPKSN